MEHEFNVFQSIAEDRKNILINVTLATLEVLKEDFGFTEEQLNDFMEKYTEKLNEGR